MSTSVTIKPATGFLRPTMMPPQNFFEDLQSLSNAISQRAYAIFQDRGGIDGSDLNDWFQAESEFFKPMPIEISESENEYTVRAEVPGFDESNLDVLVEPNSVFVTGKVEAKKEEQKEKELKCSEVSTKELRRRINLERAINPEKVTASLTKGVLQISLPKANTAKPIEIKAA